MIKLLFIFAMTIPNFVYSNDSYLDKKEVQDFIKYMHEEHNYEEKKLKQLFSKIRPNKKIKKYIKKAPERTLTWNGCNENDKNCTDYKQLFVTTNNITRGVEFWNDNKKALRKAQLKYGVSPEYIIAIIGIESKYGTRTGSFKTFDTLASLSLGPNKGRRAKFYKTELENFLLLCRENNFNPSTLKGSYAGALGHPQFISSSYRYYAVDFDNDNQVNLWNSNQDIIGSVANYFYKHGWRSGNPILSSIISDDIALIDSESKKTYKPKTKYKEYKSRGLSSDIEIDSSALLSVIGREEKSGKIYNFAHKNFYVITRYNRSRLYALAVYFLGEEIKNAKTKMERG